MRRELTSRVAKTTWSGICVSSSIKLMKSGVSYGINLIKTSRKKFNLVVTENFKGEIFNIFLVLCSCRLKRF